MAHAVRFGKGLHLVTIKTVFQRHLAHDRVHVLMGLMPPATLFGNGFHRMHHGAPGFFTCLQTATCLQFFAGLDDHTQTDPETIFSALNAVRR